jgi:hypothetical protein
LPGYSLITNTQVGDVTVLWEADIKIRHEDTSETVLGSSVAQVSKVSGETGGWIDEKTWNCPQTDIAEKDALLVTEKVIISAVTNTRNFITEQLHADRLNANTWTFHRSISREYTGNTRGILHSSKFPSYDYTRINGISWEYPDEAKLRLGNNATGEEIVKIASCLSYEDFALRVYRYDTDQKYGIPLVSTSDTSASRVRIRKGGTTYALAKTEV